MSLLGPSNNPSEKTTNTSESSRNFLDFIDKLDENTPIIGQFIETIKKIKNFVTEKLSSLFGNTRKQLTELRDEVVNNFTNTSSTQEESLSQSGISKGSYSTKKSLNEKGVKLMKDLTFNESQGLAKHVFGAGAGTDLLIKLDGGSGAMIKRMIALGEHEGGLQFGRQNPDPASGYNIGTFQIGGSRTSKAESLQKYKNCYHAGVKLAQKNGISAPAYDQATPSQRDLIAHLGYIQSQRGGDDTFTKLRDPNLSNNQVVTLMHRKIQGGVRAIGESVVKQYNQAKIDTTQFV